MKKSIKSAENSAQKRAEDSVIYKALIDLGILLAAFYLFHYLNDVYPTTDGFFFLQPILGWCAAVGAVLAAALFVCFFCLKKHKTLFLGFGIGAMIFAAMAYSLYFFWYHPITIFSILVFGGCILYLIHLLYPNDFTAIAVMCFLCGIGFYLQKDSGIVSTAALIFYLIAAVFCLGALVCALIAAKANGVISLFGKNVRVYPMKGTAVPLAVTSALCLAAIVVSVLFGSTAARYCLYGAGIYAFLAACYYTVNLS